MCIFTFACAVNKGGNEPGRAGLYLNRLGLDEKTEAQALVFYLS